MKAGTSPAALDENRRRIPRLTTKESGAGFHVPWHSVHRTARPPAGRWLKLFLPTIVASVSLVLAAEAAWIPAKAELAQWLIERSWTQCRRGPDCPPPWPWADTRPVAVLELPSRDERLVVLAGNSGRNLAFGPTLSEESYGGSDLVISGHRDTHFRFLQRLRTGERLVITTAERRREFEVVQSDIVDSRLGGLAIDQGADRVSLVTCYPFDEPLAGGPLRYVVTALPVRQPTS
jgi:sortase A